MTVSSSLLESMPCFLLAPGFSCFSASVFLFLDQKSLSVPGLCSQESQFCWHKHNVPPRCEQIFSTTDVMQRPWYFLAQPSCGLPRSKHWACSSVPEGTCVSIQGSDGGEFGEEGMCLPFHVL